MPELLTASIRKNTKFVLTTFCWLFLGTPLSACRSNPAPKALETTSTLFRKSENVEGIDKRLKRLIDKAAAGTLADFERDEAFLVAESAMFSGQFELAQKLFRGIFENSPTLVVGLKLARLQTLQGDTLSAERVVRKLSLFYPVSAEPDLALAFLQQIKGEKDESLVTLEKAFLHHPKHEGVAINYVESLIENDKKTLAGKVLLIAITNIPQSSYLQLKLARLQAEEKKYTLAKSTLDRLLRIDPDNTEAWTLAGFIAVEEKKFDDAERFFREAYEKQPENDVLARFYVGQLLRQEKYQDARRLLMRLEQSADEKFPFDSELLFQLAYVHFQLEEYDAAKKRFLALVEKAPDKGRMYFFAAQCDELSRKPEEALKSYLLVEKESEFSSHASQRVILIRFEQGKTAEAQKLLHDYEESFADAEKDYRFLVSLNGRFKNYPRAENILNRALLKFPDSQELQYLKAAQAEFLVSKEESFKQLEEFLRRFPNHAQALNHLGYSLGERGERLDFAESLLQRAVKLEPKNGFFLDSLGWIYFKKGNTKEAEKALLQALQLEPDEPIILEHLGEAKYKSKEFNLALKYFNRAKIIFSGKPEWKIQYDEEWKSSIARIELRINELRNYALGN